MANKTSIIDLMGSDEEIEELIEEECLIDLSEPDSFQTLLETSQENAIESLEQYSDNEDVLRNVVSAIQGMYHFGGAKRLEELLYRIAADSSLPGQYRVESAKNILEYEEDSEDEDEKGDAEALKVTKERNAIIRDRREQRRQKGYQALDRVCDQASSDVPVQIRVDSICTLMGNEDYFEQSQKYFDRIITDHSTSSNFRWNLVLSLEVKSDASGKVLFQRWIIPDWKEHIKYSSFTFLKDSRNDTMYRILAAQFLLQKLELDEQEIHSVEKELIGVAEETTLDPNLRADATDTLLRLSKNEDTLKRARELIMILGAIEGRVRTMFDNAQNVHTTEIEQSVMEALEYFSTIPLLEVDGSPIRFEHVKEKIEAILEEEREIYENVPAQTGDTCWCCLGYTDNGRDIEFGEKLLFLCGSQTCEEVFDRWSKIKVALNRISMDRVLHSKFNQTLSSILLNVWTYLHKHPSEEEMKKRLLEELYEMSGTCSSGFASRLVNVISGFGHFNLRISWQDQIVANFAGRLNARARAITADSSPYRREGHMRDVMIKQWMFGQGIFQKKMVTDVQRVDALKAGEKVVEITQDEIYQEFLEGMDDTTFEGILEEFQGNVLSELSTSSSDHAHRLHFLKFFRDQMLSIREEMYEEFKDHISDEEFDMSFRKALSVYEEGE